MCNHQWCRDVRRDEAVRAAEDAAAVPSIQHRDLPEVVAALTERVARLEAAQATLGSGDEIARLTAERDAARARVAELEAAAPPRGWLTAEERETVEEAMVDYGSNVGDSDCERIERVLRGLLARSSPPKVKVPSELMLCEARGVRIVYDAGKVNRAIRAAGGEVE